MLVKKAYIISFCSLKLIILWGFIPSLPSLPGASGPDEGAETVEDVVSL